MTDQSSFALETVRTPPGEADWKRWSGGNRGSWNRSTELLTWKVHTLYIHWLAWWLSFQLVNTMNMAHRIAQQKYLLEWLQMISVMVIIFIVIITISQYTWLRVIPSHTFILCKLAVCAFSKRREPPGSTSSTVTCLRTMRSWNRTQSFASGSHTFYFSSQKVLTIPKIQKKWWL